MPSGIGLVLALLILPGLVLIIALVAAVIFRSSKSETSAAQPQDDGPGRYRIAGSGGDGQEISAIIEAQSWADACRQAEDRGIEVTVVQRLIG
jgi:Na+-transporting methylmalonyl-CoA/oxaloacetate decarboxylase gamma subunit